MFVKSLLLFCLFIIVKCSNNISFDTLNNELLGDTSDIAFQNGEDVQLKSGEHYKWMYIILKNGFLEVEMDLKTCYGKSAFCYNSTDKMDPLTEMCFTGFCGFQVEGFKPVKNTLYDEYYEVVRTMNFGHLRTHIVANCRSPSIIRMQYWETMFCNDNVKDYSCAPKMDKGNKIHIHVREISPYCPVKILNAEIYDPTETTTNSSTTIGTTTKEKTEDASLPWYFWVIIFAVLIVLLIFVVVAVLYLNDLCCFAKKEKPSPPSDLNYVGVPQPKPPAEQEEPKINVISTKTLVSKESEAQKSSNVDNASKLLSSTNTTIPKDEKLKLEKAKPVVADKKFPVVKKSSPKLPTATSESVGNRNSKIYVKSEKEKKKEILKKKPSAIVANKKTPTSNVVKFAPLQSATSESVKIRNPKINAKNGLTKDDSNKNVY